MKLPSTDPAFCPICGKKAEAVPFDEETYWLLSLKPNDMEAVKGWNTSCTSCNFVGDVIAYAELVSYGDQAQPPIRLTVLDGGRSRLLNPPGVSE